MSRAFNVLCLSSDPELLETRRRILSVHYQVTAIPSVVALKQLPHTSSFQLLVLCHSLSVDDQNAAIAYSRSTWPGMKIVAVTAAYSKAAMGDVDAVVGGLSGPRVLLDAIAYLLPIRSQNQA